ncbi:hypothetical protein [Planococcus halocryophilus]|nr:hypothetical protein [Planococcus halocryophilus]MCH4828175.1 hypothetical protein [Planococcus halocryophilus]
MNNRLQELIAYLHALAILRNGGTNCNREINELMQLINAELLKASE